MNEPKSPDVVQAVLPTLWRYEQTPSNSTLYDISTQREVLAELLMQPKLLKETLADLTISDFGGSVHQSLFRTILKLADEWGEFDEIAVAQAWSGGEKEVGDALAFILDITSGHVVLPAKNLRIRVEKLQRLSHLRRLQFVAEALGRHAGNPQNDPHALIEKLEIGVQALRSGYDLNGDLLPYTPRNLTRRPDLLTLSSVEAQPVPWLWRPYLAYGMINVLSGEPGAGKTYLALSFAAALTVGKVPFSGEEMDPLNVIYLSTENSVEYSVRPRFDLLQGDAGRCHMLQGAVTGEGPKARREGVRLSDIPLLESAIKQTSARFLVVDPIQSYLGGEVDMHRSNETRPILDALALLARKHQVCLLILRHFAKSTAGSVINRGLGSIDITGAARTELQVGQHNGQYVLTHAKSNIGEKGTSIGYEIRGEGFRWTGESPITAEDLGASAGMTEEERDGLNEAAQFLEDMLKCGAKISGEILSEAKEAGFSDRMIRRAKVKLGVKSRKKVGQRYGQFEWYLDDYEDGEVTPS